EASGELAGLEAAAAVGLDGGDLTELRGRLEADSRHLEAIPPSDPSEQPAGKAFVCFCEDVTAKDIHRSVVEGYDSIELSKRFTTVTMGPCQGRMCQLSSIRLMAKEMGTQLDQVGMTTAR